MKRSFIVTITSALLIAFLVSTGLVPQPVKTVLAQVCQGAGICNVRGKVYFEGGVLGHVYDPNTPTLIISTGTPVAALAYNQPISSTAAATITLSIAPKGVCTVLTNVGSQTINFIDSGINKLSGNFAFGANDSAGVCSDGTNWSQFTEQDN